MFTGKFYNDAANGARTILSTCFGGNRTSYSATRITRSTSLRDRFKEFGVETSNRWNNFASCIKHQRFITDEIYSTTLLGISAFETTFSKDDFIYTNFFQSGEALQIIVFTSPLSNKSTMNRFKIDQAFDFSAGPMFITAGLQSIYHRGEYLEKSFDRSRFYEQTAAFQTDLFAHADWEATSFLDISAEFRTHYFSNGSYFKSSPRLTFRLFDDRVISLHAGYSKNHQFINRISFKNAVTADLWILAEGDQPPTSANQFTAGLELKPLKIY